MEAQSAERIAAVLFHGKDDEIAAAADEILRSVPEDASGRLRAYRLCALGVRNKDSALLGQAGAVLAEPIWQARILSRQAFHSCVGGRLEEAEGIYARAFPLIREHGLTRLEAVALVNLGILTEARGDPAGAIEKFRDARRLYAQIGDRAGEGLALVNSGPAYKALAAYPEAIESLVEGVELIRGSGYSRSLAGALGNLAKFYANAGVHDASIRAAHEALEVAKTHSLPTALPTAVLAESLGQAGDLVAATEASERAVELARGNGDEYTLMQTLLNLADVHRTADRLAAAEAVYEEGLRIAEHMDFLDLQLGYKLGLAYVREAQGQPETAAAIARPLLEAAEEYGDQNNLIQLHGLLGRLEESLGNPAGALRHVKRAQEVRASQFRREADVRIRSIQAAQELQLERERSAEVLRDLSQRVMESQEEERRRIASELHDGLGQELALLAVEADMLAQSQREPEEFAETLRGISEHAQSIASQVHAISHALHPAPLEQLGVITATRSLCDELARVHGVEIEVTADETRASVPRDVALCLYRIAQEALGNAIRHGQTKRASVRIAVADDAIGLVVADEGIGFDESTKRSGLGLVGMRERVRHLGGRFGLTSQPNEGTRIEVELPTKKAPSPDGERASGAGEQT